MRHTKYQGAYLTLFEEEKQGAVYERVIRKDGVVVYPLKDEHILMIYEHRRMSQKTVWRFVTGLVDKEGKSNEEIAREELQEEVGHDAKRFQLVHHHEYRGTFIYNDFHFIAHEPFQMEQPPENPDGDVIKDMKWVSLDDIYDMLDSGDLDPSEEALIAIQILRGKV